MNYIQACYYWFWSLCIFPFVFSPLTLPGWTTANTEWICNRYICILNDVQSALLNLPHWLHWRLQIFTVCICACMEPIKIDFQLSVTSGFFCGASFHVHLHNIQKPRKVVYQSSHRKENKNKHAVALGKPNLSVSCLKSKFKFSFFFKLCM